MWYQFRFVSITYCTELTYFFSAGRPLLFSLFFNLFVIRMVLAKTIEFNQLQMFNPSVSTQNFGADSLDSEETNLPICLIWRTNQLTKATVVFLTKSKSRNTGVIILPIQTMHSYQGNLAKLPYICIVCPQSTPGKPQHQQLREL